MEGLQGRAEGARRTTSTATGIEGALAPVATELPCVVAEAGGELVLLLGPEVLARCNGNTADLRGRLTYYAGMKGLALTVG